MSCVTLYVVFSPEYENWIKAATPYFANNLGLSSALAPQAARLYLSLWNAGLQPRISRGYSSEQHQKDLQAAWDRGDRQGLRVRPATTSQHTVTDWLGRPAAKAIDMPSSDDIRAAAIARGIGLGAGASFSLPDPGHYFLP